ncbi:hypothetical protein OF83DRAFT_1083831 [Amylostereum chailletii]|nr:hypothetical protein OF83DRAFT_1083831 [Amylostereum chailletii]
MFVPPDAPIQPAFVCQDDDLVTPKTRSELPPPHINQDGLWGIDEYTRLPRVLHRAAPFLAFMPVPTPQSKSSPFFALPNKGNLLPHPTTAHLYKLPATLITTNTLKTIQDPGLCYGRARICLQRLQVPSMAWLDTVLVIRALQRCVAELQGFSRWYDAVVVGTLAAYPDARGVFVLNRDDYAIFGQKVPTYLIIRPDEWSDVFFGTDRLVHVDTLCNVNPWGGSAPSSSDLRHHECWFFSPMKVLPGAHFDDTARGFSQRPDDFADRQASLKNPKPIRKRNTIEGTRVTTELRRIFNMKRPPSYVPPQARIWEFALLHMDIRKCYSVDKGSKKFIAPRFHLFWGAGSEKQKGGLVSQHWREVLNNFYWRKQWESAGQLVAFDPARFYAHGGSQIFGHDNPPTEELQSGVFSHCSCNLPINAFDDVELRSPVLFRLNLLLCRYEFTRHDDHVMRVVEMNADARARRERMRALVWGGDRSATPTLEDDEAMLKGWKPYEDENFQVRKAWLTDLRAILSDWPQFPQEACVSLDELNEYTYIYIERRVLVFYVETFLATYGYLPAPLLTTPTFPTMLCHTHQFTTTFRRPRDPGVAIPTSLVNAYQNSIENHGDDLLSLLTLLQHSCRNAPTTGWETKNNNGSLYAGVSP